MRFHKSSCNNFAGLIIFPGFVNEDNQISQRGICEDCYGRARKYY